jgi:hypothetical protein
LGFRGLGGFKGSSRSGENGSFGSSGVGGTAGSTGEAGEDGANGSRGFAIFSETTVQTGAGNDTINGLRGGFGGSGKYLLGSGKDRVLGFGNGTFNGGKGKDSLFLPGQASDYDTRNIKGGFSYTMGSMTMRAISFEEITFLG